MYILHFRSEDNPASSRYAPPPRVLPPEGIQDFDLENWRDPSQCSEYAQDIFQYYKNREVLKHFIAVYYNLSAIANPLINHYILPEWIIVDGRY